MGLPAAYLEEMRLLLGRTEYEKYKSSMEAESVSGLRLNPLKIPARRREAVLHKIFGGGTPEAVPWSLGDGYYVDFGPLGEGGTPGKHPYHGAGLYYLQEPSAMAPAALLPVWPGERVLDLCAAPGGKSTALGARLSGTGLLVANDRSVSRARALLRNLERFGIWNCLVTAEEPGRLAECFPGFFDKILVDAPCSGEGMFRREPSMVSDWEKRGPAHYVPVQREILRLACRMLRPGGLLLYSTCTFSEAEDEGAAAWLLGAEPELEQLALPAAHGFSQGTDGASLRLYPWRLKGEGHFAALFRKKGGMSGRGAEGGKPEETDGGGREAEDEADERCRRRNGLFLKKQPDFAAFRERIRTPFGPESRGYYWERDGALYLLPLPPEELPSLRYLRTGLFLGTMKRGRFAPSQALAMCLKKEEFSDTADFPAEDVRTVKYLKGETVTAEGVSRKGGDGWCLVCVDGWPLGFARRSGETLKNKYDPGWRWT